MYLISKGLKTDPLPIVHQIIMHYYNVKYIIQFIKDNDDLEQDMDHDGNDENSDNSNAPLDDEAAKLSRKVEKREKRLQHEESRLNQMR